MTSSRIFGDALAIERLRQAMRDAARLEFAEAAAALAEAERAAAARSDDLTQALANWGEALGRERPFPEVFSLAGVAVVHSETRQKAALLDCKIASQRRDGAQGEFARAEARREGAEMMRTAVQCERERVREEKVSREAEDAFLRRRS